MGSYLSEPVTVKHSETGIGSDHSWASSEMQGWRVGMEDAHITISELGGHYAGLAMFAVFDGHGGREVAKFCELHMPEELQNLGKPPDIKVALKDVFHRIDDLLRDPCHLKQLSDLKKANNNPQSRNSTNGAELDGVEFMSDEASTFSTSSSSTSPPAPEVLAGSEPAERGTRASQVLTQLIEQDMAKLKAKGSMSRADAQQMMMKMMLLKQMSQQGPGSLSPTTGELTSCTAGATAVCVLIGGGKIYCANAGDSRAVLCRKGKAVPLSFDHKPNSAVESRRILNAGGTVEEVGNGSGRSIYRVNGTLSLARAIGDLEYKKRFDLPPEEQIICSTPDVIDVEITPDDEFIVLACDGIWDVKSSQEVCSFIRAHLLRGSELDHTIENLFDACISPNPKRTQGIGGDNMTCIIVKLNQWSCGEAPPTCCRVS